jgi:hypothetical protein
MFLQESIIMQSDSESASLSDDEEYLTQFTAMEGAIGGYMFEPIRDPASVTEDPSNSSDSDNGNVQEQPNVANRLETAVQEWCKCEHCTNDLVNEKEAVCCQEIKNVRSRIYNSEW